MSKETKEIKEQIYFRMKRGGSKSNLLLSRANEKTHPQERVYFVKGMHCASCEIILEKKLLELEQVKAVDASAINSRVVLECKGDCPSIEELNKFFKQHGYAFSEKEFKERAQFSKKKIKEASITFGIPLAIIIVFIIFYRSGLTSLISVSTKSSLFVFLLFGVLAGLSSCAALVGGIVLSMSKQWLENYKGADTVMNKLQPHFLFNFGRLVSYGVLGALLGVIGSAFQFSLTFTAFLIIVVSGLMIFLSLQMLGIRYFQKFQFTVPKFITRYVADEGNFKGKHMPFIMGALTFFLPCGFTITAQGLALASGNIAQGGLIMLFFALGTTPILLGIGLSSVKFSQKPHMATRFLKIAGVLVLFFALFNINAQLNILGWASLSDINFASSYNDQGGNNGLPTIVDGKQILKMDAFSYKYEPNKLKVRVGVPVRWEITDRGSSGCTNAVMSRGLFDGEINLTKGETSVKEFTPEKVGKYKFSCWMGMVSGIIEVVDEDNNSLSSINDTVIPSGPTGSCAGGGSCGGGCGIPTCGCSSR